MSVAEIAAKHDWRINPESVIGSAGGAALVPVTCIDCHLQCIIRTRTKSIPRASDPSTWRVFQFRHDDEIVVGPR